MFPPRRWERDRFGSLPIWPPQWVRTAGGGKSVGTRGAHFRQRGKEKRREIQDDKKLKERDCMQTKVLLGILTTRGLYHVFSFIFPTPCGRRRRRRRRAARFCWGPSSSSSSSSSSPRVSLSTDVDPFSLPPLSVADHRKEKEIGGGGRIPARYDAANVVWYWIEGLLDVT